MRVIKESIEPNRHVFILVKVLKTLSTDTPNKLEEIIKSLDIIRWKGEWNVPSLGDIGDKIHAYHWSVVHMSDM